MKKPAQISLMCHSSFRSSANIRALRFFAKALSYTANLPLGTAIKAILGYLV